MTSYDDSRDNPRDPRHIDNIAIDSFADAMRVKMWRKRHFDGKGGWDDDERVTVEQLFELLKEHVAKGISASNMTDIGNYAMMIHNRIQWGLLKNWG